VGSIGRHLQVVGIGAYRICSIGHSVERTKLRGEFVNDKVVGAIFRLDDDSKPLLVLGAKTLEIGANSENGMKRT
jgi:hypothetical protein